MSQLLKQLGHQQDKAQKYTCNSQKNPFWRSSVPHLVDLSGLDLAVARPAMADHGKWISPTWGARLMDTRGPFDHRTRRINPDMSYGPQDRAYRLRWQRDQMLTPRDAATTIHDIRTNPDFIKAR